jgi:transposase
VFFAIACPFALQGYLADVTTKVVNGHPNSQIDDLLPWAYPAAPALRDVA